MKTVRTRRFPVTDSQLQDIGQHPVAIGNLTKDAGLHVIDNERQRPRVERILERFGHIEAVEAIRRRDVTSMSSQKSDGEAGR